MTVPPKLIISCRVPPPALARAQSTYTVIARQPAEPLAALITRAGPADALLCATADAITDAIIASLPSSLRVIGTISVGTDHLDLHAAARRGIAVVNTPGVLSHATAEIALYLLLATSRRANEGERSLRAGEWTGWSPAGPLLGHGLQGKTLGILGMGRIGQILAGMARAMGMTVHYHNRSRLDPAREAGAIYHPSAESFLPNCQYLALCAPGGPATHHWLNAPRIALLPRGAVVINTARGTLIDDAALIAALTSGHIGAAGLDVFAQEPHVPPAYLTHPSTVLLPHLGSATIETRDAMGALVLDGIAAVLAGHTPANLVPPPGNLAKD